MRIVCCSGRRGYASCFHGGGVSFLLPGGAVSCFLGRFFLLLEGEGCASCILWGASCFLEYTSCFRGGCASCFTGGCASASRGGCAFCFSAGLCFLLPGGNDRHDRMTDRCKNIALPPNSSSASLSEVPSKKAKVVF